MKSLGSCTHIIHQLVLIVQHSMNLRRKTLWLQNKWENSLIAIKKKKKNCARVCFSEKIEKNIYVDVRIKYEWIKLDILDGVNISLSLSLSLSLSVSLFYSCFFKVIVFPPLCCLFNFIILRGGTHSVSPSSFLPPVPPPPNPFPFLFANPTPWR